MKFRSHFSGKDSAAPFAPSVIASKKDRYDGWLPLLAAGFTRSAAEPVPAPTREGEGEGEDEEPASISRSIFNAILRKMAGAVVMFRVSAAVGMMGLRVIAEFTPPTPSWSVKPTCSVLALQGCEDLRSSD